MRVTKIPIQSTDDSEWIGMYPGDDQSAPIPLTGVEIAIKVFDFAAKVIVTQGYRNIENKPIEAVYSFPLPESAAVCGFEVETNDRKLIGKVEESGKAFDLYNEAMDEGHGTFLLDQDRPNIFTANIGNLLPHSVAIVKITYVQELKVFTNAMRLLIPTTISPRYIPLEQLIGMDPVSIDHINPPVLLGKLPYGLNLSAEIDIKGGVKVISSPSHPVEINFNNTQATVTLMGEDIQLDRDFILNIEPKVISQPIIRFAKNNDQFVVMLAFQPELKKMPTDQNAEIIFLLDRSGSMEGESIHQACQALQICLHSLSHGDRFNIISFGSTYSSMFSDSVEYNQENLDRAIAIIEGISGDLGGTEIFAPLQKALEIRTSLPKKIILITDGEFGNENGVINLCNNHKDSVMIFPIGIGQGVNQYALNAIARVANGVSEFIHPNERIEPAIIRQFNRLRSGTGVSIRIDWGAYGNGLMVPENIPQIFQSDSLIVYKTITAIQPNPIKLLLGDAEKTESWILELDQQDVIWDDTIPILMARRRIQEMEEMMISSDSEKKRQHYTQSIIELGCRYGLMSSVTSYIAIETRPDADPSAKAEYRRVPIALTNRWGNIDNKYIYNMEKRTCVYRQDKLAIPSFYRKAMSRHRSLIPDIKSKHDVKDIKYEQCLKIISLQISDGHWCYSDDNGNYCSKILVSVQNILNKTHPGYSISDIENILATIVTLYRLEKEFRGYEDQWRLIVKKGFKWLESQNITNEIYQNIISILA